jgi:signal transduction histidine kinase
MVSSERFSWRLPLLVALTINLSFGAVIAGLTFSLRKSLKREVLNRELEAIDAVVTMQVRAAPTPLKEFGDEDSSDDLFAAVLESSRLRGVLAVQLFDAQGKFRTSLPLGVTGSPGAKPPGMAVESGQRWAHFFPDGSLETLYGIDAESGKDYPPVPLMQIAVPLRAEDRRASPLGMAHFWIDGRPIAEEFARIDRGLAWQTGIAFLSSALTLTAVFFWAFAKVQQSNASLRLQGADLARANQELAFVAKTAAIGAISAHLVHEIKNPLSGLEYFVASESTKSTDPALAENWRLAAEATRRLRDLINQVVGVLRDESLPEARYKVTTTELIEMVENRLAKTIDRTGVRLVRPAGEPVDLSARAANLSALILTNIAGNAIEAAEKDTTVSLTFFATELDVTFVVSDAGPGLPPNVRDCLFQPITSTKPGGSGIGLALSRQLAQQAGGRLELKHTGETGTTFSLTVPRAVPLGVRSRLSE